MTVLIWLKQRWRLFVFILVPFILLPLPLLINNSQARCGYVVLILSAYWISEALPLPVTSLLPMILFPMAGVLSANEVAPHYFQDIITLFFGSMAFGFAVEKVNLHRRIALIVLNWVGTATKWIMAGMMGATAFLSMWMTNTASTTIMLPVALALVEELDICSKDSLSAQKPEVHLADHLNDAFDIVDIDESDENKMDTTTNNKLPVPNVPTVTKKRLNFLCCKHGDVEVVHKHKKTQDQLTKGFLLAIAYSSAIGGLSSLIGTTPNVYLKGFADKKYGDTNFQINFLNFLLFSLPIGILMLLLCWIWLQLCFNRKEFFQWRPTAESKQSQANLKAQLTKQYNELGSLKWSEVVIAIIFIILIILWVTRDFANKKGWSMIFQPEFISDGTVAVLCGLLPLIFPNSNPFTRDHDWKYEPIVKWSELVHHMSWGSIVLLGAGLSLSTAFHASKLSQSIAEALDFLSDTPRAATIMIVIVISGLFTEVTSNLSTASIFFPVLDSLATTANMHPAYLILPCTLAVSLAFMLPIATPPNAIVFATGSLRIIDMVKSGIVMNIMGFLLIFLAANTWMAKVFDLTYPTGVGPLNVTVIINTTMNVIHN